jgi:hypothetical protein
MKFSDAVIDRVFGVALEGKIAVLEETPVFGLQVLDALTAEDLAQALVESPNGSAISTGYMSEYQRGVQKGMEFAADICRELAAQDGGGKASYGEDCAAAILAEKGKLQVQAYSTESARIIQRALPVTTLNHDQIAPAIRTEAKKT